jgi:hypothetical protein
MVLLLAGSTGFVRSTIAEALTQHFPTWRHLALEEVSAVTADQGLTADDASLMDIMAACVQAMVGDGYFMLVSTDDPESVAQMRAKLTIPPICVHLGKVNVGMAKEFDHVFDTSAMSVNEISSMLADIARDIEEEAGDIAEE